MKKLVFGFACVMALLLSGCSKNLAHYSLVTTSNLPVKDIQKSEYVKGKSCINYLWFIPFGDFSNWHSLAVSRAIEQASKDGKNADALINADLSYSFWTILLFSRECITAKGQAIAVKQ